MDCDIAKLSKCFWCGGEKNELIMSTRMDSKWCDNKNKSIVANYDPCDKCIEQFKLGIQLIEAQDDPVTSGQPEISKGVYPTGRFWVINREVFKDIPEDQDFMFIKEDMAKEMGLYDSLKEENNANNS